jgi:anoctamin-10
MSKFGYLSLFSVVWPLTGLSFLINDWIELRADAIKICIEMQRPTPWRADTIGPWLDSLSFLTWMGSITSAALVYLFSNDGLGPDGTPYDIKGWGLLLSIFLSEHIFLMLRWAVRTAISKLDSPGMQKERRERFLVRKQYFDDSLSQLAKSPSVSEVGTKLVEKFDRETLEEDARRAGQSPEERFWARQKGWRETVVMGKRLIEKSAADQKGTESKKEL